MNETNPYQTPGSDLVPEPGSGPSHQLKPPRGVSAGQGWQWMADAFSLFGRDWGLWLGVGIVFIVIYLALNIIPLGSLAGNLLGPVFVAGLVLGARDADTGGEFTFTHLFRGFQQHTGALIGLGALSLGITLIMFFVIGLIAVLMIGGASMLQGIGNPEVMMATMGPGILIAVLVMVGLYIPVIMLFWFASTLVILHDVPVFEAMGKSFEGCLANIIPFTVYGLIGLIFSLIAAIPFGLGFLVLLPVFIISIYTSYKDIYLHPDVN